MKIERASKPTAKNRMPPYDSMGADKRRECPRVFIYERKPYDGSGGVFGFIPVFPIGRVSAAFRLHSDCIPTAFHPRY
jgi:hypothetical protein